MDENNIVLMNKSKINELAAFNMMDLFAQVIIDKKFKDISFYLNSQGYLIDDFLCAFVSVLVEQGLYQEAYEFPIKLLERINQDVLFIFDELICGIILLEIILDIPLVEKRCTQKILKYLNKQHFMQLKSLYLKMLNKHYVLSKTL